VGQFYLANLAPGTVSFRASYSGNASCPATDASSVQTVYAALTVKATTFPASASLLGGGLLLSIIAALVVVL
jgi:hypothetical protein